MTKYIVNSEEYNIDFIIIAKNYREARKKAIEIISLNTDIQEENKIRGKNKRRK